MCCTTYTVTIWQLQMHIFCSLSIVELYYHYLHFVTIAGSIIAITHQCSAWPLGAVAVW